MQGFGETQKFFVVVNVAITDMGFIFHLMFDVLAADPEVPGSILDASRFSEKQRAWNGVRSAS
jgi:hypothetical protein